MKRRACDSCSARAESSVAPWARSSMARSCSAAAAATASASWLDVWAALRAWPSVSVILVASSALCRPTSATCLPARAVCAAASAMRSRSCTQSAEFSTTWPRSPRIRSSSWAARSSARRVSWTDLLTLRASRPLASASLWTSSATTANPRPWIPARAASIVAFSATRFVWLATKPIVSENFSTCCAESPYFGRALLRGSAQIRQLTHCLRGARAHFLGGFLHLRAGVARTVARGCELGRTVLPLPGLLRRPRPAPRASELGRPILQLPGSLRRRRHELRRLSGAIAGTLCRRRHFLARCVDFLGRGSQGLDVLRRLVGGARHRPQRAVDRDHERELRREQLQQLAVRRAVHRRV